MILNNEFVVCLLVESQFSLWKFYIIWKWEKEKEAENSDEEKEEKEAEGRKELIDTSKSIKPFVSTVIPGFKQQWFNAVYGDFNWAYILLLSCMIVP